MKTRIWITTTVFDFLILSLEQRGQAELGANDKKGSEIKGCVSNCY